MTLSSRPLLSTPNRFTRTSTGTYWNTGNGSPDAVCFTVNRPGIVIAGVGLYGGGGTYEYDLELLDDVSGYLLMNYGFIWQSPGDSYDGLYKLLATVQYVTPCYD